MIAIKLTPRQVKELQPLQALVGEAWENSMVKDRRGAIIAQVWPDQGRMECSFISHGKIKELRKKWERFRKAFVKSMKEA